MCSLLFVQQLKDFMGLSIESVPSEFFERIASYAENIGTINPYAILVGAIAIIIMIVLPRINEKIPASLVAIIVTTASKTLSDIYGQCRQNGITLVISHINEQPLSALKKQGLYDELGEENFAPNIHEAIERARSITENR